MHRTQIAIGQSTEGGVRLPCPVRKAVVARTHRVPRSPTKCALGRACGYRSLPGREIQTGLREMQRVTYRIIEEHAAQRSSEIALVYLGEQRLIGGVLAGIVAHEPIT